MFNDLKSAYDKYILMDNRFKDLEKKVNSLQNEIEKLKSNIDNKPDPFICKKCRKGLYKPTGKQNYFYGMPTGNEYQCDNPECQHIADNLEAQKLSKI